MTTWAEVEWRCFKAAVWLVLGSRVSEGTLGTGGRELAPPSPIPPNRRSQRNSRGDGPRWRRTYTGMFGDDEGFATIPVGISMTALNVKIRQRSHVEKDTAEGQF
ncbi:hypothetical protein BC567DRAFT_252122 [Phyllosticta citribraziliensis]